MERTELTQYRVAVLSGGWSDERDISMSSGRACQEALREAGFITVELLDIADAHFVEYLSTGGYDVAFIALHGRYGEDGCIQGLLEVLHIPYTFSGVLSSALSADKERAKDICRAAGIPVPSGVTLAPGSEPTDDDLDAIVDKMGLPLFVKPVSNGSSFGISCVNERGGLAAAVRKAESKGDRVLVEECVSGVEITVPVIGNDEPRALPIIEIALDSGFYDLKVKYEPASLHHIIPARLDETIYKRAEGLGIAAHKALGCRGVSRTDFIVKDDGTPVMLETNSIPGMTDRSLLPDAARHAGIEFSELCTLFVQWALEDVSVRAAR
jgi:D-ala D-ala ligase N-terminal domain protein